MPLFNYPLFPQFFQNIRRDGNRLSNGTCARIPPSGDDYFATDNILVLVLRFELCALDSRLCRGVHHPHLIMPPPVASRLHHGNRVRRNAFLTPFRISDNPFYPLGRQTVKNRLPHHVVGPMIVGIVFGTIEHFKKLTQIPSNQKPLPKERFLI